jgi:DNA polymerase-4
VHEFLNPLSIKKIPMIGDKAYRLLRSMGVDTIETLSRIPPEMVEKVLGKNGLVVWKKANGVDTTPVKPYSERKSIGSETTFETDTIDVAQIRRLISVKVERLAFDLRKKQKLTSCITVKIRYSNFDTHTLQQHIPYTSFDHVLIKTALELFDRLYQRRMLIRLVGVKFSHLVGGVQQLDMFEDTPEMVSLYNAMDTIRLRFGKKAIRRAIGVGH